MVSWLTFPPGDSRTPHYNVPTTTSFSTTFPVPNTKYLEFFLSSQGKLSDKAPASVESLTYNTEDRNDRVEFTHTFAEPSRLIGIPKTTLYVSAESRDDFVIFVILRNRDLAEERQEQQGHDPPGLPVLGSSHQVRGGHRQRTSTASTPGRGRWASCVLPTARSIPPKASTPTSPSTPTRDSRRCLPGPL